MQKWNEYPITKSVNYEFIRAWQIWKTFNSIAALMIDVLKNAKNATKIFSFVGQILQHVNHKCCNFGCFSDISSSYKFIINWFWSRYLFIFCIFHSPPCMIIGSFHVNSDTFWQKWKSMSRIFLKFCTHILVYEKMKNINFQPPETSGSGDMRLESLSSRRISRTLILRNFFVYEDNPKIFFLFFHWHLKDQMDIRASVF